MKGITDPWIPVFPTARTVRSNAPDRRPARPERYVALCLAALRETLAQAQRRGVVLEGLYLERIGTGAPKIKRLSAKDSSTRLRRQLERTMEAAEHRSDELKRLLYHKETDA